MSEFSPQFFKSIIDSLPNQVVVIDATGLIEFVNRGWVEFSRDNDGSRMEWRNVNYLDVCREAAAANDESARDALAGIERVMAGTDKTFYLEYPCPAPGKYRWFLMRVSSFSLANVDYFVISHADITERKQAEDRVLENSRLDGLTGIANRSCFDDVMKAEWKRLARFQLPLTLAFIDIDNFKIFNDTYGHQAGDQCLRQVASTLAKFARRPGDACARYGGEEFALMLGNTDIETSTYLFEEIRHAVEGLRIENSGAPGPRFITISIGVAWTHPHRGGAPADLMKTADSRLYEAKRLGRNRVVFGC